MLVCSAAVEVVDWAHFSTKEGAEVAEVAAVRPLR